MGLPQLSNSCRRARVKDKMMGGWWMDGWMDGWMNKKANLLTCRAICLSANPSFFASFNTSRFSERGYKIIH